MTIQIDLYSDWIGILKAELGNIGYDTTKLNSDREVSHAYFNVHKRMVEPVPRAILKSQTFTCPQDLQAGLVEVENKITAGTSLRPNLSKRLTDLDYDDPMLNDWGIHHIHLGTVIGASGFTDRTGPLLFARFDRSNAYLLGVFDHGHWSDQSLIQLIHDNWPDSIKNFRVQNIISGQQLTDENIATLRKKNINGQITVSDGTLYGAIGGGYVTSGKSLNVVMISDRFTLRLQEMQKAVADNIDQIKASAIESKFSWPENPCFKLVIQDGNFYALETNTSVHANLGPVNA